MQEYVKNYLLNQIVGLFALFEQFMFILIRSIIKYADAFGMVN